MNWEQWTERGNQLIEEYAEMFGDRITNQLFDFLTQSDVSGQVTYGFCKKILSRVNEYKDTVEVESFLSGNYGYGMRPQTGADIVRVLDSCATNKKSLKWW